MKTLADHVRIAPRFQRAIRVDSDLGDPAALEGFVCPETSREALLSVARHVADTRQAAFTWTGPYGSGKSSLAVVFGSLMSSPSFKDPAGKTAAKTIGRPTANAVRKALPPGSGGWRVLAVQGRQENPVRVVAAAFRKAAPDEAGNAVKWGGGRLVEELAAFAAKRPRSSGGLIVLIDEMGKFLEAAARGEADIHFFQDLAEAASRSKGRLIVVGILHQAFAEYAQRASRGMREEWAKIQGRFVDMAISATGEEQIHLLSRAIDGRPEEAGVSFPTSRKIASLLRKRREDVSDDLEAMLHGCWPLHPLTACLLGPISRRRFGQNQRSIFAFLNSSEPCGLQDFLKGACIGELYEPDRLWDYLQINLEPAILASPDGHRWATAVDAVERCRTAGLDALHLKLVKTTALIDLFRERSGIAASASLLKEAAAGHTASTVRKTLDDLAKRSLVVFRKHADSYAVFAGSDFDVEKAIRDALPEPEDVEFGILRKLAGLRPVVAKRHYDQTGALRWFNTDLARLNALHEAVERHAPGRDQPEDRRSQPEDGSMGVFLLALPVAGEDGSAAKNLCRKAAEAHPQAVIGLSARSRAVVEAARDLVALERIRTGHPEIAGDAVARREIEGRLSVARARIEEELRCAFDDAEWHRAKRHREDLPARPLSFSALSELASEIADETFPESPRVHNELLNRLRPSSSAVAARNALLQRMVAGQGEPRLGIEGFPAEGGLFVSLLERTGIYAKKKNAKDKDRFCFLRPGATGAGAVRPGAAGKDPGNLAPAWNRALDHLSTNGDRAVCVDEIYKLWREAPFGIKDGVMPVLVTALILSERDRIALYREKVFQPSFEPLDVEYLASEPGDIELRWVDLEGAARDVLFGLVEVVRDISGREMAPADITPIHVARALVAVHQGLPSWTRRTTRLSGLAGKVRDLFGRASDPNELLFDDIPVLFGDADDPTGKGGNGEGGESDVAQAVRDVGAGLRELVDAYPSMLQRFGDKMLDELGVPNRSSQALAELRDRARNIEGVTGDFRLEALAKRLAAFEGTQDDMEGIAGLAANKPSRDWVDPDHDRALMETVELARKFLRAETVTRIKGRPARRHALAVVVGFGDGHLEPLHEEFEITDAQRMEAEALADRLARMLDEDPTRSRGVILAALSKAAADSIRGIPDEEDSPESSPEQKQRVTG